MSNVSKLIYTNVVELHSAAENTAVLSVRNILGWKRKNISSNGFVPEERNTVLYSTFLYFDETAAQPELEQRSRHVKLF